MASKYQFHPYGVTISLPDGDVILNAGANMTILPQGNLITFAAAGPSKTLNAATYTPTLTNTANVTASMAYMCQYMQVGNVVTVSGKVSIQPTAPTTSTILGISLPVSSAFTAEEQCGGTAFAPDIAVQGAAIFADVANKRAILQYISVDSTNQRFFFSFTYKTQ